MNINYVYNILDRIKNTSSTNGKREILENCHMELDDVDYKQLKRILYLTYNPFMKYGLTEKTIPTIEGNVVESNLFDVETFAELLSISNINDELRECAGKLLAGLTEDDREIAKGILCKDLKLGINATGINKVFEGLIPKFDVQLAYGLDKVKLKGDEELYITRKLDGVRCVIVIEGRADSVKFYSRKGKEFTGLNQLEASVRKFWVVNNMITNVVLDGELLLDNVDNLNSDDLYRATTGLVNSKSVNKEGLQFNLFDVITLEEFRDGKSEDTYSERRSFIDLAKETVWVKPLELLYVGNDHKNIQSLLEYVESDGGEGIMINLDKIYECKRTKSLIKVKSFNTADVRVIGFAEGSGRNKGRLGALEIEFEHEGVIHTCEVGSGFDDGQRVELWNIREELIGKIIEIQYFEISKNKQGEYSLRFPTFKWCRFEKDEISMH